MSGQHCPRTRVIAGWREREPRPVNDGRLVTAWTVLSLGLMVVVLSATFRATSWSADRPPTALPIAADQGRVEEPGPVTVLRVGPERPMAKPSATPPPADAPARSRSAAPPRARTAVRAPVRQPARPVSRPARHAPRSGSGARPERAAARCVVTFTRSASWDQGYVANVVLRNVGDRAVRGWTLSWQFRGDQRISNLWNGQVRQRERQIHVRDSGWNSDIAPGASVQLGFEATAAPPSADPASFALNDARCG